MRRTALSRVLRARSIKLHSHTRHLCDYVPPWKAALDAPQQNGASQSTSSAKQLQIKEGSANMAAIAKAFKVIQGNHTSICVADISKAFKQKKLVHGEKQEELAKLDASMSNIGFSDINSITLNDFVRVISSKCSDFWWIEKLAGHYDTEIASAQTSPSDTPAEFSKFPSPVANLLPPSPVDTAQATGNFKKPIEPNPAVRTQSYAMHAHQIITGMLWQRLHRLCVGRVLAKGKYSHHIAYCSSG